MTRAALRYPVDPCPNGQHDLLLTWTRRDGGYTLTASGHRSDRVGVGTLVLHQSAAAHVKPRAWFEIDIGGFSTRKSGASVSYVRRSVERYLTEHAARLFGVDTVNFEVAR